jgi:hypothetical protein
MADEGREFRAWLVAFARKRSLQLQARPRNRRNGFNVNHKKVERL